MAFSDIFSSTRKGEGFERIPSTPEQDAARSYLMSLFEGSLRYPTQPIAEMTDIEKAGQDILSKLISEGPSKERETALSYLTGLLDTAGDLTQLPEIKALMSSIEEQTADLVNSALRRTQIEGMGTSGPQGSAVGREIAKGRTSMVSAIAPYLSQVRSDKLSAASLINQLLTGGQSATLGKLGAVGTYGALPREIEQMKMTADYQKRLNDLLAKFNLQAPMAQTVLGEPRYMYDPGTLGPSPFSQISEAITGATKALYPEGI